MKKTWRLKMNVLNGGMVLARRWIQTFDKNIAVSAEAEKDTREENKAFRTSAILQNMHIRTSALKYTDSTHPRPPFQKSPSTDICMYLAWPSRRYTPSYISRRKTITPRLEQTWGSLDIQNHNLVSTITQAHLNVPLFTNNMRITASITIEKNRNSAHETPFPRKWKKNPQSELAWTLSFPQAQYTREQIEPETRITHGKMKFNPGTR